MKIIPSQASLLYSVYILMPAVKGAHTAVSEDTTLALCDYIFST